MPSGWRDLRGAEGAAARPERNVAEAFRAGAGRRVDRRLGPTAFHQLIHGPDHEEEDHGSDHDERERAPRPDLAVPVAIGPERLSGDWWSDGYSRDYWRCESDDGVGELVLYRDAGGWWVQGWYD